MHSIVLTKEAYLAELQRLARKCENADNLGAAVKATELQGKVMGHYVDKHEDVTPRERVEGKRQEIASILSRIQTNPLLLARLTGQDQDDDSTEKGLSH